MFATHLMLIFTVAAFILLKAVFWLDPPPLAHSHTHTYTRAMLLLVPWLLFKMVTAGTEVVLHVKSHFAQSMFLCKSLAWS